VAEAWGWSVEALGGGRKWANHNLF